jgi:hypothetical protein
MKYALFLLVSFSLSRQQFCCKKKGVVGHTTKLRCKTVWKKCVKAVGKLKQKNKWWNNSKLLEHLRGFSPVFLC